MSLSLRCSIFSTPTTTTFQGACASGSNFYTITDEPKLRKYTISSASAVLSNSASLGGSAPSTISFIAPASTVISYSGGARFDIYDANTFANTGITTNALATERASTQQIAGIPALNLALATSSTTGKMTFVSLTCAAQISPPILASQKALCVVARPDTNTWLVGTNNGKILEFNSSATLLTTVDVPSSNYYGSAPTISVESLSYYNGNYGPIVLACTDSGQLLSYNWSNYSIIDRMPLQNNGLPIVSLASSGTCIISSNSSMIPSYKGLAEVYFETGYFNIDNTFFLPTTAGIVEAGIEPTIPYAWTMTNTNGGSNYQISIYNITSTTKETVSTQMMNPVGNPIAARIIRLRDDNGVGNACVEFDATIYPGVANPTCTTGRRYIEIGIQGNIVNGNPPYTGWDIREFQG